MFMAAWRVREAFVRAAVFARRLVTASGSPPFNPPPLGGAGGTGEGGGSGGPTVWRDGPPSSSTSTRRRYAAAAPGGLDSTIVNVASSTTRKSKSSGRGMAPSDGSSGGTAALGKERQISLDEKNGAGAHLQPRGRSQECRSRDPQATRRLLRALVIGHRPQRIAQFLGWFDKFHGELAHYATRTEVKKNRTKRSPYRPRCNGRCYSCGHGCRGPRT